MGLNLIYAPGQTPIDENEKEGLLIKSISTQSELNQVEQLNIQQAIEWTLKKKFKLTDVFTETFITELHRHMYQDVWRWAGLFRKTEKNLGVGAHLINIELKKLLNDGRFWVENQTMPFDETAIRFKHRIVSIHCFSNGNGRHSRLIADIIASHLFGEKVFSWGSSDLSGKSETRSRYISALHKADSNDLNPLLTFARS